MKHIISLCIGIVLFSVPFFAGAQNKEVDLEAAKLRLLESKEVKDSLPNAPQNVRARVETKMEIKTTEVKNAVEQKIRKEKKKKRGERRGGGRVNIFKKKKFLKGRGRKISPLKKTGRAH